MAAALLKGGLVVLAADGGGVQRTIVFQYNPETLTRRIGPPPESPTGAVTVETLRLEAAFDATDALAEPERHPAVLQAGIAPTLAALEALVLPGADAGAKPSRVSMPAPLVLFVWGRQRVQPVRVLALDIVEQAFDRALNPLRAQVTLQLQALTVQELGAGGRGAQLVAAHLRTRAALAAQLGPQGLDALGLGKLP